MERFNKIASYIFDLTYADLCQSAKKIHCEFVACEMDEDQNQTISPWIPQQLIPFVNFNPNLGIKTLVLNITPTALNHMSCENHIIEIECRVQGTPTFVHVPTNQVIALYGFDHKNTVIDMQRCNFTVNLKDVEFENKAVVESEPIKPSSYKGWTPRVIKGGKE